MSVVLHMKIDCSWVFKKIKFISVLANQIEITGNRPDILNSVCLTFSVMRGRLRNVLPVSEFLAVSEK